MDLAALENQAIRAALAGGWEKAIGLNRQILNQEPENTAALNRLAKAFWETNQLALAKKTYQKVLKLNQFDPVATKNLKRLTDQRKKNAKKPTLSTAIPAGIFVEEPGKARVVKLLRLAPPKVLAEIDSADEVFLQPRKRLVTVIKKDGTYLGSLPEDLSQRLNSLIKRGNRYQTFVKAVDRQHLEVFIREVYRSERFKNIPSFVSSGSSYLSFNFDQ